MSSTPHAFTISSRLRIGHFTPPTRNRNSAMALWYWAPPYKRMPAFCQCREFLRLFVWYPHVKFLQLPAPAQEKEVAQNVKGRPTGICLNGICKLSVLTNVPPWTRSSWSVSPAFHNSHSQSRIETLPLHPQPFSFGMKQMNLKWLFQRLTELFNRGSNCSPQQKWQLARNKAQNSCTALISMFRTWNWNGSFQLLPCDKERSNNRSSLWRRENRLSNAKVGWTHITPLQNPMPQNSSNKLAYSKEQTLDKKESRKIRPFSFNFAASKSLEIPHQCQIQVCNNLNILW